MPEWLAIYQIRLIWFHIITQGLTFKKTKSPIADMLTTIYKKFLTEFFK